jgi:aminoglycoside 3-N-acetyltransferase
MRKLGFHQLTDALGELGLQRGDCVHLQSDLRRMGPVESAPSREAMLEFYLRAFESVLGSEGTLTVLTATMACGRYGTPFVREKTPSEVGVFSEYVRTRPGAVRSLHPILSVAGLGPRAAEICAGAHFEGVGYDSPWGRLHRGGAKLLTLGMSAEQGGTTFFHYVESAYGVPYKYTKLFSSQVISNQEPIPGLFTMSVRYHDFQVKNTSVRLKRRLLEQSLATQAQTGQALSWCSTCPAAFDLGIAGLREDRYFLLEEPPRFRPGEIPFDGPSGEIRLRYDQAAGMLRSNA